jgi:hypothetical protein
MSLEPAIALLAGLLLLGQIPGIAPGFGVVLVVIAGIGATRGGARASAPRADHDPCPARSDPPRGVVPVQSPVPAGGSHDQHSSSWRPMAEVITPPEPVNRD